MNKPTSDHPQVKRWLEHIYALAVEIGPRGPTREGERKGAEYVRNQFERLGFIPRWENFKSARSIFHPHLLGAILLLAAFGFYPLAGKISAAIAALLTILVLISEVQELSFRDNLFRMVVPKGESQNVFTVIPPAKEHYRDLILVGHVDSQLTPLIFRSSSWVKIYDKFTMIAFITFIGQAVFFVLGAVFGWGWVWYASIPAAICAVLLAAMCLQADTTPFTAGANDNASAVGLVLTLAEELKSQPLQNTRVLAVVTGCEEVQHYGMIDFYKRHRAEMKNPYAVVFEMLGCAGPAWTVREGIIVPFKSDPKLVRIAERLAAEHPEWEAYPVSISGGNSELSDAVRFNVPAITFFGLTRDGEAPYWHQKEDTFDKMNPVVMERTWQMVWEFLHAVDEMRN